jgi:hypothetical protein
MKFSIRDLFLVTLIVALAVGWWVDRSKLADEVRRLRSPPVTEIGGPPPYWDFRPQADRNPPKDYKD